MRVGQGEHAGVEGEAIPSVLLRDLVDANHILAREDVLDGFGHVSARDPTRDGGYLISRSLSPELVGPNDIFAFDANSQPVFETGHAHYAERVIHARIYAARPDVRAVCHCHAAAIQPFANTGRALTPVIHLGAVMGDEVPFWDSRDEFGDTDMLVRTDAQADSLARALGSHWSVILRRHGLVVAGRSVRECVFRAIHLTLNARIFLDTLALGEPSSLTSGEVTASAEANLAPSVQERLWTYWTARAAARFRQPNCESDLP
jgi:ribulose-5-phosphate 4-epimerase/fuculose-1-phosphate aldolase